MSSLTPDQRRALRDVAQAWPGVPAVLIGASALACQHASYRRQTNDLDLEDLAFLLEAYLGDQDRTYELIGAAPGIDYENTSAFALGLDAGQIVNAEERALVSRFIADAGTEDSRIGGRLLRLGPVRLRSDEGRRPARLGAFERGFSRPLPP